MDHSLQKPAPQTIERGQQEKILSYQFFIKKTIYGCRRIGEKTQGKVLVDQQWFHALQTFTHISH
jgi:hypothetical protein